MNEHDVASDFLQGVFDGLRARLAAEYDAAAGEAGGDLFHARKVAFGRRQQDLVKVGKRGDRPLDHARPPQGAKEFVFRKTRSRAPACRTDDDADHGSIS